MNDTFPSEKDLVCALKERNPKALQVIHNRYAETLSGVASTVLKDQDCSGVILQDIFLAIWDSIDQYDPAKSPLLTWMYHIAQKHALAIHHTQTLLYVNDNPG
ncbi:RNA polymerase sigma factor [Mucilaginibacter paludis]|uniref:Sigma-70 region 2 domain protein n=1 Tax=Mucilaginibacter paludis DSM 18603 TaxID=714943 RepID=H1Y1K3_9SPHI|nr:sigma factor [Mucilaginibacter paludis]EHQ30877.1 sigma-70 region 2 domain protein [Mucilaginibacter paludis DSM 18603]